VPLAATALPRLRLCICLRNDALMEPSNGMRPTAVLR
jgi:hypothetical protein